MGEPKLLAQQLLIESNIDLLSEVNQLLVTLKAIEPPYEQRAYYETVYELCEWLRWDIQENLERAQKDNAVVRLREIFSDTQTLSNKLSFQSRYYIPPLLRYKPEDKLSLRLLTWLHTEHQGVSDVPAALINESFQAWTPEVDRTYQMGGNAPSSARRRIVAVVYGVPVSIQYGLLYQPLFFHEFGHLLFAHHRDEMRTAISTLQSAIDDQQVSWVSRSDKSAQRADSRRGAIVSTWYLWCEELFCDAVGLHIGGPAFLYALDRYVRIANTYEYHLYRDKLAYREHPIFRLRIKILAHCAETLNFTAQAQALRQTWDTLAIVQGEREDYYGFYEDNFMPPIQTALTEMLNIAQPYHFTPQDLDDGEWTPDSTPVHLVNLAWTLYTTAPQNNYIEWEREMINRYCAE